MTYQIDCPAYRSCSRRVKREARAVAGSTGDVEGLYNTAYSKHPSYIVVLDAKIHAFMNN